VKDFKNLEKQLGIKLKDKGLLTQSFCHRSYLNENSNCGLENNERLEFLGDAVIELIVTEYLYKEYPKNPEGELTNWRASLVNAKKLSEIAQKLGFNDYLLLSKGEDKEMGKARQYILADTFEAFIGAVYLDRGYKACEEFIKKHLLPELTDILKEGSYRDAKSLYQEQAQEKTGVTPIYRVMKEVGPDHAKHFTVGVFLDKKLIAEGTGSSKQEAEESAAKRALDLENK
jgi:ribonuclease-3